MVISNIFPIFILLSNIFIHIPSSLLPPFLFSSFLSFPLLILAEPEISEMNKIGKEMFYGGGTHDIETHKE